MKIFELDKFSSFELNQMKVKKDCKIKAKQRLYLSDMKDTPLSIKVRIYTVDEPKKSL